MELTIDQALQQGVAAHKEGKLQDAERLYRAILQAQPKHPDANHNLGVLAVAVGKRLEAIPLFKQAVEANPQIEQFWLSYIDALIKLERFEEAMGVLVEGEKSGISEEQLDALNQRLQGSPSNGTTKAAKGLPLPEKRKAHSHSSGATPSQEQINHLLEHYQAGRFAEAELLATSLTQKFPKHPFAWKVLGVVFQQTGRLAESLALMQKAIELSPQDAEARNNLGVTLQSLGMLEEAELSYQQAIAIKSDYAEAHDNLAATLRTLGKLDEAEHRIKTVIALRPDYAEAHSHLGNTLQKLGRLVEAVASYQQAIMVQPDYADAYINLGTVLQQLNRSAEAIESYSTAIKLKPESVEAHYNLGAALEEVGRLGEAEVSFRKSIALKPGFIEAYNQLLKCLFSLNKRSSFLDQLNQIVSTDKTNAVIGSLACRAKLKYGVKVNNSFCSHPLKHLSHIDLTTQYDFEQVFVWPITTLLEEHKLTDKSQTLLINGKQTSGNLFSLKNASIGRIESVIRTEIEKYRLNFEGSSEGFMTRWPSEYTLKGWVVRMKSGGRLKPHIHENGWLSGSVYIHVPPNLEACSGNLNLAEGEESDVTSTHLNKQATVNVQTGSLVLFPSSTTHYTSPFHSEEQRIVLAFDVVRK